MDYIRRIRDLREDHDKTQQEIATVLGNSQTMYERYERGANELPIRHLLKLCDYYFCFCCIDFDLNIEAVFCFELCDDFFDIGFSDSKFVGIFSLDNSFRIGKDISLELNGFVQTPATQGTFSIETMWSVSAGAKWNFAGGNGTLACYYNDIFNSTIGDMRMNYKGQNLLNRNDFHSRNFTLSLTYRFGGYRKQESKAVDTSRFGH